MAAFGRGECFVERYLDRPRHVEAQVLADTHGNVVVVGTRDCSLQRRHQKLVEEAPAPFLTDEQRAQIHASAKAICREAGYHGAGTVEYLVGQDGTISFLEVNTRLQVEHPVSEETAGIDLVREQFRIADGEALRFTEDPAPRGHSIEFRINGEDAGRNFLPAPGTITALRLPAGPGVRVDAGVETGSVIGGNFDSLLAKIIVTGATATRRIERARRVLDETVIEGIATVLPFHRAVVRDPAFTSDFTVHTRWIETEWAGGVAAVPGRRAGRRNARNARPSWSRSAASDSRSACPKTFSPVRAPNSPARPAGAGAGQGAAATAGVAALTAPDAGHHRQGRGRRTVTRSPRAT